MRSMPIIKVNHEGKVETMALESYVAAVLAGEVSPSWPKEALKAQAIASRTFAIKRMKERKDKSFHVDNSVMDQVFRHQPAQVFIDAVKETVGLVLSYNDEVIEASFHSTCGGHTASSKDVWGKSYPYLKGVECGFCEISPSYKWSHTFKKSEAEKKLGQKISALNIYGRTSEGRVSNIKLGAQKMTGYQFRMKMGATKVKSTRITELSLKDKLSISGQGFGHGVGLCQYGALGMAKSGREAAQILAHYYPGTEVKKLY